jgi:uncharacterized protein YjiS (DUF1127 family)
MHNERQQAIRELVGQWMHSAQSNLALARLTDDEFPQCNQRPSAPQ